MFQSHLFNAEPSHKTHRVCNFLMISAMATATFAGTAHAQDRDPMLFYDANGLKVRGHLQFGLNAVAERNLFWDLAGTTAPGSGFDADTNWLEGYIKPGVSFEYQLDAGTVLYGKLSAVSSYTWGTDAFDTGDNGETTLEEAYLAVRGQLGSGLSYDLSVGPRELSLGTGMLVSNGATSGFERGALKFGPRKAWEKAAIAKLSYGNLTGTAFYLDPNELPSKDGKNELAGVDLRYDDPAGGVSWRDFRQRAQLRNALSASRAGRRRSTQRDAGCPRGHQDHWLVRQDKPVRGRFAELDLHW